MGLITDLFSPWNSDNKEKRMKAVEEAIAKNDLKKLIKIVTQSEYYDAKVSHI